MTKTFSAKRPNEVEGGWEDNFRSLKSDKWAIVYNSASGRVQLENSEKQVHYSCFSSHSCRMIAAQRYNIDYLSWN